MVVGLVKVLTPKIIIDLNDIDTDNVAFTLAIVVSNMYSVKLYYMLEIVSPEEYSFNGEKTKELGGVDPNGTSYFFPLISRPKPDTPTTEDLTLTLHVYSDENYTNEVDSVTFKVTIIMDMIEGTLNQILYDFESGREGWDVEGGANWRSYVDYEGGGGSIGVEACRFDDRHGCIKRTITIQGTTKAYLKLKFTEYLRNEASSRTCRGWFSGLSVIVGGKPIYSLPIRRYYSGQLGDYEVRIIGWKTVIVDLSEYIGKSVEIKICAGVRGATGDYSACIGCALDHIVIAWD